MAFAVTLEQGLKARFSVAMEETMLLKKIPGLKTQLENSERKFVFESFDKHLYEKFRDELSRDINTLHNDYQKKVLTVRTR